MIFGRDRGELRAMYVAAWRKSLAGEPLSPLESQIAAVVAEHPEYHPLMTGAAVERDFLPEGGRSNPFLHMGLHLAIREQVATDRPAGIRRILERLRVKLGDAHEAEHRMLECLAESLWEAQRRNELPDEAAYLARLERLG